MIDNPSANKHREFYSGRKELASRKQRTGSQQLFFNRRKPSIMKTSSKREPNPKD